MDGKDFDQLAKRLGGLSRRQTIGGLVGAALAAAGLTSAEAKKGRKKDSFSAKDVKKGRGIGKSQCGTTGCIACSDGSIPTGGGTTCPVGEVLVCTTGTSDTACGSGGGGNVCTACTAPQICALNTEGNGGTCVTPPPNCGFGFGDTCIAATGGNATCRNAAGPNACGVNPTNGSCLPDCGEGNECVFDGGATLYICTSAVCTQTCPDGCCVGPNDPIFPAGSCQNGTDILACGSGGGVCTSCLLVCGLEGSCVNGVCSCLTPPPPPACPTGLELCGDKCVDLATSKKNCGACGSKCGRRKRCKGGTCQNKGGNN